MERWVEWTVVEERLMEWMTWTVQDTLVDMAVD